MTLAFAYADENAFYLAADSSHLGPPVEQSSKILTFEGQPDFAVLVSGNLEHWRGVKGRFQAQPSFEEAVREVRVLLDEYATANTHAFALACGYDQGKARCIRLNRVLDTSETTAVEEDPHTLQPLGTCVRHAFVQLQQDLISSGRKLAALKTEIEVYCDAFPHYFSRPVSTAVLERPVPTKKAGEVQITGKPASTHPRIDGLSLSTFTAFQQTSFEFSPGLNVFLGANSTGKTHVLKVLYALCKAGESIRNDPDGGRFPGQVKEELLELFMPFERRVSRLFRTAARPQATLTMRHGGRMTAVTLEKDGTSFKSDGTEREWQALYLPPRETLVLSQSIVSVYERTRFPLDKTYRDLSLALAAPEARQRTELAEVADTIEEWLGGSVVRIGDVFMLHIEGRQLEASLVADGYRKLAMLAHLIRNGSLTPHTTLFWDEPESSFNPILISKVAYVIRRLVAAGVQVFLASHDFLLTSELSMAQEYKVEPAIPAKFFCLFRSSSHAAVEFQEGETLADLNQNPILQEFAAHYDREHELFGREQ